VVTAGSRNQRGDGVSGGVADFPEQRLIWRSIKFEAL
jgi:hypothetical protein